jgi:hypothetical protein
MSLPILSCQEISQELDSITLESKDKYLKKGMEDFLTKISVCCQDINKTRRAKKRSREKINKVFDWFEFCEKNIRRELLEKQKLINENYPLSPVQRELCKKEVNFLIKVRGIIDQKKPQFTKLLLFV